MLELLRPGQEAAQDDVLETGYLALTDLLERPDDGPALIAFEGVIAQLEARQGGEVPSLPYTGSAPA